MFLRRGIHDQKFPREVNFSINTKNHRLEYMSGGETLIVSFDDAARSRDLPFAGRSIWGESFYLKEGHSLLGVIARTNDWFRCSELIVALKEISSSGFFSQFEKVVMTGASMSGFAAGAFAPLAPGCTVIAISPQATRDPAKVPWETRFPNGRDRDWSLPFNNAGKGARAASKTYVFFDSLNRQDLQHARIFAREAQVDLMPIPAGGHGVGPLLVQMDMLKQVTRASIDGSLTRAKFFKWMRARKETLRYHRILAMEAFFRGRNDFAIRICDTGIKKFPRGGFREIKSLALAASGKPILAFQMMEEARAFTQHPKDSGLKP